MLKHLPKTPRYFCSPVLKALPTTSSSADVTAPYFGSDATAWSRASRDDEAASTEATAEASLTQRASSALGRFDICCTETAGTTSDGFVHDPLPRVESMPESEQALSGFAHSSSKRARGGQRNNTSKHVHRNSSRRSGRRKQWACSPTILVV